MHETGDVYEGDLERGMANGFGKYTHFDGSYYEGSWELDYQHGKGKEVW